MAVKRVCYYDGDNDGIVGALLLSHRYPDMELVEMEYHSPPPPITRGIIYMVDFCIHEPDVLSYLAKHALEIHVFDHHPKTKVLMENLSLPNVHWHYAADKCGASLVWDHFHGVDNRPDYINYIEDYDLWRFQYPETKAFNLGLRQHLVQPYRWPVIWAALHIPLSLIDLGQEEIKRVDVLARTLVKENTRGPLQLNVTAKDWSHITNYQIPAILIDCPEHRNEIAECLMAHHNVGMAAVLWDVPEGRRVRLVSDGQVDMDFIARQFGGGGHATSAGFLISTQLGTHHDSQ